MRYFTTENTEGYSQEQLNKFNDQFPVWAEQNGFELEDENELTNASDKFFNNIMVK